MPNVFCPCLTYNKFKCVMMCVVFVCMRVRMRASVHIEKLNCTCMNCVALIHNLSYSVGICSNLV